MSTPSLQASSASFPVLSAQEIASLSTHGTELVLQPGDLLFHEGVAADSLYIVLDGVISITRRVGDAETTLATHHAGEFTGALEMLSGAPAIATGRALERSRVLKIETRVLKQVLVTCPVLADTFISAMTLRMRDVEATLRQHEKLASLGVMSAGLAHELNNPAAAANRAATQLQDIFTDIKTLAFRLNKLCQDVVQLRFLSEFQHELLTQATVQESDTLVQADREEEIIRWLNAHRVSESWKLAPSLATAGLDVARLDRLAANIARDSLEAVLHWLDAMLSGAQLLATVKQSATRISDLVRAIKEYTYRDQTAQQEIDLHQGLENTLVILGHKLRQHAIQITRDYAVALPRVCAYGSELNQVWTNIIDNAIQAAGDGGTLRLRTCREHDQVLVEIGDNGPGIPLAVQGRIFEPFFTTRGVGEGTGLGLDIAWRAITRHRGTLQVQSQPGDTRFQVRLPLYLKDQPL